MSFIGDAEIKENVNIGAGTITCNHNRDKHVKTIIDEYAYVGAGCVDCANKNRKKCCNRSWLSYISRYRC